MALIRGSIFPTFMQNVLLFVAGIVLLCLPCAWFCRQSVRLLPISNFLEHPALVGGWLSRIAWWNLIRAGLGVWLLRQAPPGGIPGPRQ